MSSLNSVGSGSQLSGFHMVNRAQDLDEASSGSTVSSHLVSSPASYREAGGAEHFHIGSRPASQDGGGVREEAPQPDQSEMIQSLMASVQELQASQQSSTDLARRLGVLETEKGELAGRVDILFTDNEGLRSDNVELRTTNAELAGRVSGFEAQFTRLSEENQGLRRTSSERRLEIEQLQLEVQALNAGTEENRASWIENKETLEGQVRERDVENTRLRGEVTTAQDERDAARTETQSVRLRADASDARVNRFVNMRTDAKIMLEGIDDPALGAVKGAVGMAPLCMLGPQAPVVAVVAAVGAYVWGMYNAAGAAGGVAGRVGAAIDGKDWEDVKPRLI